MSENAFQVSRVIALEEHAWPPELRAALLKFGGDDTVTTFSDEDKTNQRLHRQSFHRSFTGVPCPQCDSRGVYPAARRRDPVLYLGWSPGLVLILAYGRGSFQRRINDAPSLLDVVLPGEQGSISRHRVAQHPFIGIHIVWGRRSASRNFRGNTHRVIARKRKI
jgi:hypothetical protein